jgi:arylformamidase
MKMTDREGNEASRRIHDISVPVRPGMVVWEGDSPVTLERFSSIADGADANVSRLDFGVHTGTHIDAPIHFIDGAPAAEALPLDALLGPTAVVDATGVDGHLDAAALAGLDIPEGTTRVIFKTRNSLLWEAPAFDPTFAGITEDAARRLVERGIRLVGIDYLSIAPKDLPVPTHRTLLEAGVVVLEGLDLRGVEPGSYELVCLPLRLVGSDGAPCRAVLIER